jgi:hypothetical protein
MLSEDIRQRLEQALASARPVDALREFALELAARGLRRQSIYDLFFEVYKELQEAGRERDEQVLGDVMDMVTGTYSPYNLDIPP